MNGHMDFHKSQTVESLTDTTSKMKDEPGTSHLLCISDLVPRKKIPKHHMLALELHENSLPRRFQQRYSKVKKNTDVKQCSTSKLKNAQLYFYAPYHVITIQATKSLCGRGHTFSLQECLD
jgi:hypothetical protein